MPVKAHAKDHAQQVRTITHHKWHQAHLKPVKHHTNKLLVAIVVIVVLALIILGFAVEL